MRIAGAHAVGHTREGADVASTWATHVRPRAIQQHLRLAPACCAVARPANGAEGGGRLLHARKEVELVRVGGTTPTKSSGPTLGEPTRRSLKDWPLPQNCRDVTASLQLPPIDSCCSFDVSRFRKRLGGSGMVGEGEHGTKAKPKILRTAPALLRARSGPGGSVPSLARARGEVLGDCRTGIDS